MHQLGYNWTVRVEDDIEIACLRHLYVTGICWVLKEMGTETSIGCPLLPEDMMSSKCTQRAFNFFLSIGLGYLLKILFMFEKDVLSIESSKWLLLPKESIVFH